MGIQMKSRVELWCDGEQAVQTAIDLLNARDLQVVRSFDLQRARSADDTCPCPNHGTERCDCSYMVLLVYPPSGPPAVVTAHSCSDHTILEIALDPNALPDRHLVEQIQDALLDAEASPASRATPPVTSVGPRLDG